MPILLLRRALFPLLTIALCWAAMAGVARADEARRGRLVDVAWLQQRLADVILLDASMTPQHRAGHIPGAVSADLYRYGPDEASRESMDKRIQSWGVSPGRPIVVYDQGGEHMATRLFFDLYLHGIPAGDLYLLDGGLARWRAQGGAVTREATPMPAPGSFRISTVRDEVRVRLPEFLVASGDRANHALVDALEPNWYYGVQKFFDRAGHVPNAILMPAEDFYNADKTFKSPEEIRRLARYHGIRPDQVVHSYCGGGVAASVPWFALHFLAEHPKTKLYLGSQREWLRDERGLPLWTYAAPQAQREPAWLNGWNAPMLRMFGASQLNLVDVRAPDRYALSHVPFALNISAQTFRSHVGRPDQLAELLGPAGVNPAHEVVLMAESGLTPGAALAFLAFEQLGHRQVSVLMDSVDEWGLRGFELTKEPTAVGTPATPRGPSVPPARYTVRPRSPVLIADPQATRGEYAKVFVAAGRSAPSRRPEGTLVALPYTSLLDADAKPKPAKDLWALIGKAGVPRHAEVIVVADDLAEAAVGYYVFRLMGWPDVKVWAP